MPSRARSTTPCEACAAAFLRPNPCLLPREGRLGGERCKHFLTISLRHITTKHLEELGGRINRDFGVSKAPGHHFPINFRIS